MLSRLTRSGRWSAAVLLSLAYALCTLAPAASFAFGDGGTRAAHCLTGNDDHGLQSVHSHQVSEGIVHTHADGTPHVHAHKSVTPAAHMQRQETDTTNPGAPDKTSDGKCCGLMCVPALPAILPDGSMPDLRRAEAAVAILDGAAGQPAARLDRPPNTPLSL